MWLLRQHRQHEYRLDLLSESIGQDPRQVERWLQGYNWNGAGRDPVAIKAINIVTIDEVGVYFGDAGLLERLYPLEVDE
jgi:hypothetical protein